MANIFALDENVSRMTNFPSARVWRDNGGAAKSRVAPENYLSAFKYAQLCNAAGLRSGPRCLQRDPKPTGRILIYI